MDMKLEVAMVPATDVDRAVAFYKSIGWRLDADFPGENDFLVVQLTPPGSTCSVIFGSGVTDTPPGSADHLLAVTDVEALKPGLVIHSIYNGYWFWGRPSIDDLRHDLRAVSAEIRPDWDLSTPGLREKWDAGDFSPFHGWNRRGNANANASA